jgi:hypothetical protein
MNVCCWLNVALSASRTTWASGPAQARRASAMNQCASSDTLRAHSPRQRRVRRADWITRRRGLYGREPAHDPKGALRRGPDDVIAN